MVPLRMQNLNRKRLHGLMAIASGALLGAAFLHIIPEAVSFGPKPFSAGMVLSFLGVFSLEQFTLIHSCPEPEEECPVHVFGLVSFVALCFHSFVDGLAMASGFSISVSLGVVTSVAVMLHKFPDGLSTSALLLASGYPKNKVFPYGAAVAAATPVGALIAYLFIRHLPVSFLSAFLGVSAGSFIYIGASDILPRLHTQRDLSTLGLFAGSMLFMLATKMLL